MYTRFGMAILFLILIPGCGGPNLPKLHGNINLLSFLDEGISREEVLLELGVPSASFEDGRILTYRLGGNEDIGYLLLDRRVLYGRVPQGSWDITTHSLVIVFDENGFIEKHKLIVIK